MVLNINYYTNMGFQIILDILKKKRCYINLNQKFIKLVFMGFINKKKISYNFYTHISFNLYDEETKKINYSNILQHIFNDFNIVDNQNCKNNYMDFSVLKDKLKLEIECKRNNENISEGQFNNLLDENRNCCIMRFDCKIYMKNVSLKIFDIFDENNYILKDLPFIEVFNLDNIAGINLDDSYGRKIYKDIIEGEE